MRRHHGPCDAVVLLHLRRLDRFLKHHGLHHTAHTLEQDGMVFFDAPHLQRLVMEGEWDAAELYLRRFSSLWAAGDGLWAAGEDDDDVGGGHDHGQREYSALLRSLRHHSTLAWYACRGEEGGRDAAMVNPPDDDDRPGYARSQDIYRSMASQQARESVDWDGIKRRTADRVDKVVQLCPHRERMLRMRLPQCMPLPSDILPLSSRRRRSHPRKGVGRRPAHDLAKFLLQKRLSSTMEISHSGGDKSGASSEVAKS